MKKQILILLTLLACLAFQTDCHQKKTPSGPDDEDPLTEIVYGDTANATATCPQYDIDWPSLADSPWPMAVVDQQGVSRSELPVLTEGSVEWYIDLQDYNGYANLIEYGCAVGPDGSIYVMEVGLLTALTPEGQYKWITGDSLCVRTGPIVGRDSTIYFGCKNYGEDLEGGFVALRPDGTVKWVIKRSENFPEVRPFMGIDGTLYARNEEGMLYAISRAGDILWQKPMARPGWNIITASPDGSTLYLMGPGYTLVAMDAQSGAEYWSVDTGMPQFHYASVDNQGNVYFYRANADTAREIVALTPDGKEKWCYHIDYTYPSSMYGQPMSGVSIAYNGFIYMSFPDNALYSIDYNGLLRWYYKPLGQPIDNSRPIICDGGDNVIHIDSELALMIKLNQNGNLLSLYDINEFVQDGSASIRPCALSMNGFLLVPCGGPELMSIK